MLEWKKKTIGMIIGIYDLYTSKGLAKVAKHQ